MITYVRVCNMGPVLRLPLCDARKQHAGMLHFPPNSVQCVTGKSVLLICN
jgi:hypothetical protein